MKAFQYGQESAMVFPMRTTVSSHAPDCTGEDVQEIPQHLTVNGSGSIRQMYRHAGKTITAVRSISLRNYYLIEDEKVARLIMASTDELPWLHDVPVAYYPITHSQLQTITSLMA